MVVVNAVAIRSLRYRHPRFFTVIVIIVTITSHRSPDQQRLTVAAAMSQQPVVAGSVNNPVVAVQSAAAQPVGSYIVGTSSQGPPFTPQQSVVAEQVGPFHIASSSKASSSQAPQLTLYQAAVQTRIWAKDGHDRWQTQSEVSISYERRSDTIRSDAATNVEVGDVSPRNKKACGLGLTTRIGRSQAPNWRREPLRRRVWRPAEGT